MGKINISNVSKSFDSTEVIHGINFDIVDGEFIVLVGPLFLAFVTLGVLIVWKTTSNPSVVAPHLDIILVSFAIFANPVTAAAGVITGLLVDSERKKKE